jgi:hypothetical protein
VYYFDRYVECNMQVSSKAEIVWLFGLALMSQASKAYRNLHQAKGIQIPFAVCTNRKKERVSLSNVFNFVTYSFV